MAASDLEEERITTIYRIARSIKKKQNSLYNILHSIYNDSIFVAEIAGLWPDLPLVANLRCGLWYSPRFDATCYFKSTDGHANNWSFSTSRLNLHLALLAGQRGGCIIVDSTRKGKRFPDSMSKTIPIWICVLNRAIERWLRRTPGKIQVVDCFAMFVGVFFFLCFSLNLFSNSTQKSEVPVFLLEDLDSYQLMNPILHSKT